MPIDFETDKYQKLLEENVKLTAPFSPAGMRALTLCLLLGKNYRLLTEQSPMGR
jgi:hypothetical protein